MTTEEIAAQLDNIANLTDEEITELHEALIAQSEEAREASDVDLLTAIADGVEAIRTEQARRETVAAERDAEIEAQIARITPPVAETPEETTESTEGGDDSTESETTETVETETTTTTEPDGTTETETTTEQPEAVAAAVRPSPGAALRNRPRNARPTPQVTEPQPPAILAAAGSGPEIRAGEEIDFEQLGQLFSRRYDELSSLAAGGGMGSDKHHVAMLRWEYPEDRQLAGDQSVNQERIEAVTASIRHTGIEALVAAGGLCAPVAVSYDLANVSSARRPMRDALLRFGADRGGVRYVEPPTLADLRSTGTASDRAVDVFTEEQDTTSSAYPKGCQTIVCGDVVEVFVDAITKCLRVGNFSRRTFPEQFRTFWELASARHARVAEDRIWDRMVTLSTAITAGQVLGTARDVLATVDRAAAGFRSRHRMDEGATLRFFAPEWLRDQMRVDLARQLPGDNTLAVADATIASFFTARNIAVTWSPDGGGQSFGAEGGGGLDPWPSTVETILTHEGAFTWLDGGELDFGIEIRDSTLNAANDSQAFMETFENVAFTGVESLAITMDVCPDGSSSLGIDISPCVTGS